MTSTDRFGLPVTTADPAALQPYVDGLDRLLAADIGAEPRFDTALAADPEFALAHIARARMLFQQGRPADAREAASRARACIGPVTARERRHVETVAASIEGRPSLAMTLLEEHVAEFPRDALVLSLALGVYGLFGFSGRSDFHEAQLVLIEGLAGHWDGDWWFDAYHGWGLIETGAVARGVGIVERALQANPRNAYAAHGRAHGYHEVGDADGGAAFAEHWLQGYDRAGLLHGHIAWHWALCELARGNSERALDIYRADIRPAVSQAPPLQILADAASFLWRWRIYGETPPLEPDWAEIWPHAERHAAKTGVAFFDLHGLLAAAASGDEPVIRRRVDALCEAAGEGQPPNAPVRAALSRGLAAFARGDHAAAADALATALAELPRIGGSHAQREIFEDMFVAACLGSQRSMAEPLLRRRLARRPSGRDERWLDAARHGG